MIMTQRDNETACADVSANTTRLPHKHNCTQIVVEIDVRVWQEICDSFPVDGVNYQTAELNRECRLILTTFVLSALRDSECQFSFNQQIADDMTMVGHRKRKALVFYLRQSRFFDVAVNYSTGNHSIIRTLKGARTNRLDADHHVSLYADQHNMVPSIETCLRSDLPLPDVSTSLPDACLTHLRSLTACWTYSGSTCLVMLPVDWFRRYGQSYRNACKSRYSEQWQFVSCIESSIDRCVIGQPTYEECFRLSSLRRTKPGKRLEDSWTPEKWAFETLMRWNEWREDPLLYLNRVERRLYYPFVNQSKLLRRRYMQFMYNGELERSAEFDMSCTFWVFLASMLDESPCKARLIQDLKDGLFYERLNEAIGGLYRDRSELKVAVQKDCLFGKKRFGGTPLFSAMFKLYPDLAKFILSKRKHHNVNWLSDLLTNVEGSFFIDCLLPQIVKAGIPALPIHDAFCVPASAVEQVERLCRQLAQEKFGFEPGFKVSLSLAT
jgi:hypothetical protein